MASNFIPPDERITFTFPSLLLDILTQRIDIPPYYKSIHGVLLKNIRIKYITECTELNEYLHEQGQLEYLNKMKDNQSYKTKHLLSILGKDNTDKGLYVLICALKYTNQYHIVQILIHMLRRNLLKYESTILVMRTNMFLLSIADLMISLDYYDTDLQDLTHHVPTSFYIALGKILPDVRYYPNNTPKNFDTDIVRIDVSDILLNDLTKLLIISERELYFFIRTRQSERSSYLLPYLLQRPNHECELFIDLLFKSSQTHVAETMAKRIYKYHKIT